MPERYQLTLPGDDGLELLERKLTDSELDSATKWVGPRISNRCVSLFLNSSGQYFNHQKDWYACVRGMLDASLNQLLEAPYLFQHKYDELEFDVEERERGGEKKKRADYLVRRELSNLVHLGLKFKVLLKRKEKLEITFEKLMAEIEPKDEDNDSDSLDDEEEKERKRRKKEDLAKQRKEFDHLLEISSSSEEVSDLTEWLVMIHGQRMRDAQTQIAAALDDSLGDELDSALNITSKPSAALPTFKKPSIIGLYESTKSSIISKLASRVGISASELASNISSISGSRQYYPDDEMLSPETLSQEYEVEEWHATGAPLKAAQMLLSNEIGRHPTLKREVRKLFKETGKINISPTERGAVKIDDQHMFYGFKFLKEKPIGAFLNPTPVPSNPEDIGNGVKVPVQMSTSASAAQWLQILAAENDLLINVSVELPQPTLRGLIARLYENYQGEGTSEASKRWNEVRKEILEMAVEKFLIPNAKNWIKEWLKEECTDVITKNAETNLIRRINCAPYQSKSMKARSKPDRSTNEQGEDTEDEDEDDADDARKVPRVLAVSQGSGDTRRGENVISIFLDSHSRFRHHAIYPHLREAEKEEEEEGEEFTTSIKRREQVLDPRADFIAMVKERRPDVIVVNGFSHKTVALTMQLNEIAQKVTAELIEEAAEDSTVEELSERTKNKFKIDVIHCHDDIARLYQHSSRAVEEFPELSTLGRYCVGLARYVQSPLLEFASLKQDLTTILLDPNQRLVPEDRLREFLERSIVAYACETGVDINRAVSDTYYANLLPYVAGLGPRKAHALVRTINRELDGTVVNRAVLLELPKEDEDDDSESRSILHFHVWTNCISFLRIVGEYTTSGIKQGPSDPLDSTRIHPEDYDYPRKMASDALNLDEEDLAEQHASAPCKTLMESSEPADKLKALDLEHYANMLFQMRGLRKRNTLQMCARELAAPYHELRAVFLLPTEDDMLTMLTGETSKTLDYNLVVPVTVVAVAPTHLVVRLDSGIEGTINAQYFVEETISWGDPGEKRKLRDYASIGKTMDALIIDMDKNSLRVELTALKKHLQDTSVSNSNRTQVDPVYFDQVKAMAEASEVEAKAAKAKNRTVTRNIKHPDFKNFKSGQAEEYLAGQPRGSLVVRPSSKGNDHLAVTWKIDDGVFQHIGECCE